MIKGAFMLGAGLGLVSGMFLVKMCPKVEKMVDDVKSKAENAMSDKACADDCGCGCNQNEGN